MLQREAWRKVKIERGTMVKSQLRNQHQRTARAAVSFRGGSRATMLGSEKRGRVNTHCMPWGQGVHGMRIEKQAGPAGSAGEDCITPLE